MKVWVGIVVGECRGRSGGGSIGGGAGGSEDEGIGELSPSCAAAMVRGG